MNDVARMREVFVTPPQRQNIFALYDSGLYLQAYRHAEAIGPLQHWRGPEARVLAGRMAGNLGSMRLADWHFVCAWRKDREHAETLWYFARYLLGVRGPLAAWRFVQTQPFPDDAPRELRSHWCSQRAAILGHLRDFDAAEDWLKKAEAIGVEPWTCLEWATLHSLADRHAEAEAAARRALELRPWYRPAVQWVAHFLVQKERDQEALDLLTQASQRLESGAIFAQLAGLQLELQRFDDAARSLDEYERLSPLLPPRRDRRLPAPSQNLGARRNLGDERDWLEARRCDLACYQGDFAKALDHANRIRGKFYEGLAKRLETQAASGQRHVLPVGFVRQHHKTCAPATLTSIAKFWSMPAEHVEVADEIAYVGTQHHHERKWAEEHGWHAKSFTVTWDAAVALIDAGIPFTLATTEVASAHLQAVIGYDSGRGTFIVRDPGERHKIELPYDLMLERYRSTGPRGMAMVPLAHKEKLDALALPDEKLYEHMHQFDLALAGYRRADAEKALQAMSALSPGHFQTLHAQRVLAIYDADLPQQLACTEELLKRFPGDLRLELDRVQFLRMLGRRDERLDILRRLCEQEATDPACWQFYAEELSYDARRDRDALSYLRKAIRATPPQAPLQGRLLDTLARIAWANRRFDEAMQLYHFATCVEDKDEFLAQNYFTAALGRGQGEEVLTFLHKRFQRFGAKSSHPARTLYGALWQMERRGEAFETLDEAMRLRPDDGELLTYAADAHMQKGEFDKAEAILARAEGVAKPAARLRSLAYLAAYQEQRLKARDLWAEVLKLEPFAEDAQRNYLQLLAEMEERPAALRHLETVCQRFPHHFGLNRLWYDWLFLEGPAAREPVLKKLIAIHPPDVWARVEYAMVLSDLDRPDEAHRQLDDAEPLDPHAPNVWFARGILHKKAHRVEDAMHAFREAIRLSVDYEFAIRELIWLCENVQERRDAMAFVANELLRQATFGPGILVLREVCFATMPLEEMLGALQRILDARPDLWQAWSVVTLQLVYMERSDEALTLAQKAVQRFPSLSQIWLDLADVHRLARNSDSEIEALKRAVALAPTWNIAVRMLAEAHERAGQCDDAKQVYEQAIRRAPLLAATHLDFADLLWRIRAYDEAIRKALHALKLDPWLDVAWNRICNWCSLLDRADEAIETARDWTKTKPGEPRSWLRLGFALHWKGPQTSAEAEKQRVDDLAAAYDQALQRDPFARDVPDFKAEALALAGRYDEALKASNPPAWKGKPPVEFRGRAAWTKAIQGEYGEARKQMTAILKNEYAYPWGWNQLVDWSFASGEFKDYLDAAGDYLRVRPQAALALTYRGEARLRMDERDAGIEDLQSAYRRDPCNTLTGYLLFDEQMNDENHVGAETTLLSLQQNIGGEFVKARQVQFHAKKENKEIALEKFKELCLAKSPNTMPLDMAIRAIDLAGWKEPAEQILREAMKDPQFNLHLALIFAQGWNPNLANDLPDRIAVLDRALERQPDSFRFLDFKAELLANGAQFDRAWQVCEAKTLPFDQYCLDGRAAWVIYRSGRGNDAIPRMREILQEHPKYYWGWSQLADWYGRAGHWGEVLTVAEELVRLAPRDPMGFGYRGQAKENLGDAAAARADYIHALDIQPAYVWAAWMLYSLYVRNQEWQRAEKILEKAKRHADKGEWALRKVDMLVYLNRKANFPAEFENLLRNSQKAPWLIDQSLQYLIQAGWWSDAEEVLHRCLDLGAHICDPWVRLRVAMGDRKVGNDVQNMSESRPERSNCIAAYAVELAYAKDAHGLRRWIQTHEDALRDDTPCWAKVGNALYIAQDWQGVADWMSDWPDHPKALPGMLLPLIKALRSLGRVDDARKVSLHALTKLNADWASSFHKVWLMFDQALDGELLPVQRYLEQSDLGGFDGYHQMIAAEVRALSYLMTDKATGFQRARQVLADTAKYAPPTVHDPALKAAYQQCVARIAQEQGSLFAKLWRWWRWLVPTLPQVPKPPG